MALRVGVLASGRGSNFQAIIDGVDSGSIPATIAALLVNRRNAGAVQRAEKHNIPWVFVDHAGRSREDFEAEMIEVLEGFGVELVVLAGFMRILTPLFVEHYAGRIMNVHPALLPSFPGTNGQRDALAFGAKVSGCTVHFVNASVDSGPIIIQRCVPVKEDDTEASLSARILEQEHIALPMAVSLYARGLLRLEGDRVRVLDETNSG